MKNSTNIAFGCKSYYINFLITELGIDISLVNLKYVSTRRTIEETLDNKVSALCFFTISPKDEELNFPSQYRIQKLHNCP